MASTRNVTIFNSDVTATVSDVTTSTSDVTTSTSDVTATISDVTADKKVFQRGNSTDKPTINLLGPHFCDNLLSQGVENESCTQK